MNIPLKFFRVVNGPTLYSSIDNYQTGNFQNTLEIASDWYFNILRFISGVLYVSWPTIIISAWRSERFLTFGKLVFSKYTVNVLLITLVMFTFRGTGRLLNSRYIEFCDMYYKSSVDKTTRKHLLKRYDFQMKGFTPGYTCPPSNFRKTEIGFLDHILYFFLHPIIIRITYPGMLITSFVDKLLKDCRIKLMRRFKCHREWIMVGDSYIDVMFIDRRSDGISKLIIVCEGNGSFYENGCFQSMSSLSGYNVLGWNRPQFGESCGRLSIESEQNSAIAVIHYALSELGFSANDITLYGWSIGGYSALVISKEIAVKRIILDATFDDVVHLAKVIVPIYASLVTKLTRQLINLNNSELICRYNGEIKIIRRTEDEIVSSVPGVINYNRGNNLLIDLLKFRYPTILNPRTLLFIENYITLEPTLQNDIAKQLPSPTELCTLVQNTVYNTSWPYDIAVDGYSQTDLNAAAIILTKMYLFDVVASHCQPIDPRILIQ